MGRDATLPVFFGRLHRKYQTPWNAQHVSLIVTLIVTALWGRWLGFYLSYDWWGSVVVFFVMISNVFVNVGCAVFFYGFRGARSLAGGGTALCLWWASSQAFFLYIIPSDLICGRRAGKAVRASSRFASRWWFFRDCIAWDCVSGDLRFSKGLRLEGPHENYRFEDDHCHGSP
jgi:amino acid transporter